MKAPRACVRCVTGAREEGKEGDGARTSHPTPTFVSFFSHSTSVSGHAAVWEILIVAGLWERGAQRRCLRRQEEEFITSGNSRGKQSLRGGVYRPSCGNAGKLTKYSYTTLWAQRRSSRFCKSFRNQNVKTCVLPKGRFQMNTPSSSPSVSTSILSLRAQDKCACNRHLPPYPAHCTVLTKLLLKEITLSATILSRQLLSAPQLVAGVIGQYHALSGACERARVSVCVCVCTGGAVKLCSN